MSGEPGLSGSRTLERGDRVLLAARPTPVMALVVNPDGPVFAKDGEDGRVFIYIGAVADVLVKIELSAGLENLRKIL